MVFVGTAYFVNKDSAIQYYAIQGIDERTVKEYIKEGLIYIGKPESKYYLTVDGDGRYWTNEQKGE